MVKPSLVPGVAEGLDLDLALCHCFNRPLFLFCIWIDILLISVAQLHPVSKVHSVLASLPMKN